MTENARFEDDYARDLIWLLFDMTGGPLPPYLLEIVLKDGRNFYVHSANSKKETTRAIVLNVYDLRAIGNKEETAIRKRLEELGHLGTGINTDDIHPLLAIGRLRCNLSDISYCIEWLARRWTLSDFLPEDDRRPLGFETPKGSG